MTIDDKTFETLRQIHSQLKLDEEVSESETKIMNDGSELICHFEGSLRSGARRVGGGQNNSF